MSLSWDSMKNVYLKEVPLCTDVERFLRYIVNEKKKSRCRTVQSRLLLCKSEGKDKNNLYLELLGA